MLHSTNHHEPHDHVPQMTTVQRMAYWLNTWLRQRWKTYLPILLIFAVSRGLFYVTLIGSQPLLPILYTRAEESTNQEWLLDAHYRWDATIYLEIATKGYATALDAPNGSHLAFFPLLPITMHMGGLLLGGSDRAVVIAGIIIAQAASLVASCLLFALARATVGDAAAYRAVVYSAIFPLAVFFNVPYTESLFLLFTLWAFLALRRRWWVSAGIAIALASACRIGGLLLMLILLLEWHSAQHGTYSATAIRRGLVAAAIAPLGLLLFLLYLHIHTGDALIFLRAQSYWPRSLTLPPITLFRGIGYALNPALTTSAHTYVFGVLNTLIVVLFLAVSVYSWRRWPAAYTLYALLMLTLALISPIDGPATMQSTGRYVMIIFPVLITLGQLGQRRLFHILMLVTFTISSLIIVACYTHWFFIV